MWRAAGRRAPRRAAPVRRGVVPLERQRDGRLPVEHALPAELSRRRGASRASARRSRRSASPWTRSRRGPAAAPPRRCHSCAANADERRDGDRLLVGGPEVEPARQRIATRERLDVQEVAPQRLEHVLPRADAVGASQHGRRRLRPTRARGRAAGDPRPSHLRRSRCRRAPSRAARSSRASPRPRSRPRPCSPSTARDLRAGASRRAAAGKAGS